jgi:hypothetical protein
MPDDAMGSARIADDGVVWRCAVDTIAATSEDAADDASPS